MGSGSSFSLLPPLVHLQRRSEIFELYIVLHIEILCAIAMYVRTHSLSTEYSYKHKHRGTHIEKGMSNNHQWLFQNVPHVVVKRGPMYATANKHEFHRDIPLF